ncbi:GL15321 [Drosophila persimilis]|uniref:GL15321 n=1 Tax=Drosophila persimilis TaxID=7234 RepID=B4H9E2_DROPE|nr:GL15321 [Drosophila persimilis]
MAWLLPISNVKSGGERMRLRARLFCGAKVCAPFSGVTIHHPPSAIHHQRGELELETDTSSIICQQQQQQQSKPQDVERMDRTKRGAE